MKWFLKALFQCLFVSVIVFLMKFVNGDDITTGEVLILFICWLNFFRLEKLSEGENGEDL